MTTRSRSTAASTEVEAAVNEVRLQGRLSQQPEERTLPSGDVLWTFRIVVQRPAAAGRAPVDAIECVAWTARVRRSVATWAAGDVVAVDGSLRRRFFRTPGGTGSRVEVEVSQVRMVRRARTG